MKPDWRDYSVQAREDARLRQYRPIDANDAWGEDVVATCGKLLLAMATALCLIAWLWK